MRAHAVRLPAGAAQLAAMQFEEDDEDEAWLLSAALEADAAVAVVSAERWTCSVCTTSGNTAGANCQSCGAAAPRLVRPAAATPAAGLRAFFAPQEAPEELRQQHSINLC